MSLRKFTNLQSAIMKPRIATLLFALVIGLCLNVAAESIRGLKPRSKASEYPVFKDDKTVTIGAVQLSARQVTNSFATGLNGHYIVVEVGVYPSANSAVEVNPDQFELQVAGSNEIIRPAAPGVIASVLQKKSTVNRDISLYPTAGVGYSTGGRDVFGNRQPGGVTTEVGLGVGVGNKQPASTDADRKTMETELRDKSLPEGKTDKAVAGYLYFPVTTGKKVTYQLRYSGNDQTIRVELAKPTQ